MDSLTERYDSALIAILKSEEKIDPFLDVIFGFLYRKTDFYRIRRDKDQKIGFYPEVAEKLAREAFQKYQILAHEDSERKIEEMKRLEEQLGKLTSLNFSFEIKFYKITIILLAAQVVAHEEEVVTENTEEEKFMPAIPSASNKVDKKIAKDTKASDSYNGADRGAYSWSQSIQDIDIRVKLPKHVTQAKQIKVDISATKLCVKLIDPVDGNSELVNGEFTFRNKEFVWTLVPGEHVHVFLEKCDDRWWEAIFTDEPKINLREIEATMPMEDLDDEAHAKVQELMFNEHQKRTGGLTSDQIKMNDVLKGAWDQEGSPFKGMPFDPSIVQVQNSGSF
ncbi:NudC domain-containing protein 3 [Nymphon striatum]|nr:NudC domain-containing protein 3 [Nymphon striatum]